MLTVLLSVWTFGLSHSAGKYVGSRPITIKKATTEVRAVEIGEKKARKLESEAKARAKSGVQKSGKGLGSAANYKGLGPSACESPLAMIPSTLKADEPFQISDVRYLYMLMSNNGELFCAAWLYVTSFSLSQIMLTLQPDLPLLLGKLVPIRLLMQ